MKVNDLVRVLEAVAELKQTIHNNNKLENTMKTGVELIAEERKRQTTVEPWTDAHDDGHEKDELALAASCYAIPETHRNIYAGQNGRSNLLRVLWPWDGTYWKPSPNNRIKELVKAGALIAAEIDRLQRKQIT